ncbi:unnamed protein product, partial [Symbiodinium pilosum]
VQLGKCRTRLALPAVGTNELGRLLVSCAEVLAGEESTTEAALARGRAGWLLDRLMPLLARADNAAQVAPLVAQQLGQGLSKQAARSFQRLLRRLSPQEAQEVLRTALQSHLKVAERVALLRDLSDLNLFEEGPNAAAFVALLEPLRNVGACNPTAEAVMCP